MSSKNLLPAWTYEEKAFPTSCILSSFAIGLAFLAVGGVLTAIFRKIPLAADIAMGGVALIVLGVVLILTASCLTAGIIWTKKRLPKTSSAAKADVPPDPFSLVPVYPANSYPAVRDAVCSPSVLLLPGGVDPIYSPFETMH